MNQCVPSCLYPGPFTLSAHPYSREAMNIEQIVRIAAGLFILLSLALGYFVNPLWFLFTAFVGLNLFQSAFTGFCPLEMILERVGVKHCGQQ